MHDVANCTKENCYGCKLASLNFDPYAMPSRLNPNNPPKRANNSYNKGFVRGADGKAYHRPDGSVIGLHELTGNHQTIEREIRDRYEAGRAGRPVDQKRTSVST